MSFLTILSLKSSWFSARNGGWPEYIQNDIRSSNTYFLKFPVVILVTLVTLRKLH